MINSSNRIPDSFQEKQIDLSNLSLNFVEGGNGYPVVFLHAYIDTWYSFRLVLPLLADHCRCLVLDQRGHGKSNYSGADLTMDAFAEDVIEFLQKQGLEQVTLVGNSMGSFVARKVSLRCPELVERLVLVGSRLRTDNHELLIGLKAAIEQLPEEIPREFVEALLSPNTQRGTVPDWFFNVCVEAGAQMPGKIWRGTLDGMLLDNHSDQLGKITQPTLVIGGKQDEVFKWEDQEELARILPHARFKLYEDVGHYPHWERPEQFAKDLLGFIRETNR